MANQQAQLSNSNIMVVMVPFPAQSHLNQLLQLSHIISSHNIKVHYVASSLNITQVKSRATDQNPNQNIHFHGLQTPDFQSPPPNSTGFPSHLLSFFESTTQLRTPVKNLIESLSEASARLILIHDPLMTYVVQDYVSLPNVEAYVFHCVSAIYNFNFICNLLGLRIKEELPWFEGALDAEFLSFCHRQQEIMVKIKISGFLHNTCRLLEREFLDFILGKERELNESAKHWAFGPLGTETRFKGGKGISSSQTKRTSYCLEWLDEQEQGSVLYVSFGTTTHMRDDQIKELAIGLEESGAKFIWVLRNADKGDIFDESGIGKPQLPLGFEERVEGMGMGIVVREWAPQLAILGHPSTGGFMSHCGWNSVLESLSLGVPLVAWPMHSDQPTNAFLVTEILKAGLNIREWAKRDELVSSSVISKVVKRLMSSDDIDGIRKRARELGCELRKCTQEGGACRLEMNSFIAHITRT